MLNYNHETRAITLKFVSRPLWIYGHFLMFKMAARHIGLLQNQNFNGQKDV